MIENAIERGTETQLNDDKERNVGVRDVVKLLAVPLYSPVFLRKVFRDKEQLAESQGTRYDFWDKLDDTLDFFVPIGLGLEATKCVLAGNVIYACAQAIS